MRRLFITAGAAVLVLMGLRYLLVASAPDLSPTPSMADDLPANPLSPCPSTPNCARTTRLYDVAPDTLFARAETTLRDIGATSVASNSSKRRLHAIFRVVIFKDDVHLAVEPHEDGSALHIRSASRVGHSDLGVNARRVHHFLDALSALQ